MPWNEEAILKELRAHTDLKYVITNLNPRQPVPSLYNLPLYQCANLFDLYEDIYDALYLNMEPFLDLISLHYAIIDSNNTPYFCTKCLEPLFVNIEHVCHSHEFLLEHGWDTDLNQYQLCTCCMCGIEAFKNKPSSICEECLDGLE
jgi:hypothetical protein